MITCGTQIVSGAPVYGSGGVPTYTSVPTASGWTTGGTGGTVTQGATLALTITAGQYGVVTDAYVPRATRATTAGPRKRLRGRVASLVTQGSPDITLVWVGFGTASGPGYGPAVLALVRGDGLVELAALDSSGALLSTIAQSSVGALPLDGTGWIELSDAGGLVSLCYGTGTSSTPPADDAWTSLAGYAAAASTRGARAAIFAMLTQWTNQGAQAASIADLAVQVIP